MSIPSCLDEIPASLPKRKAFVVLRNHGEPVHAGVWNVAEWLGLYVLTHPENESAIVIEPGATSTITYVEER